ncbi:NAD(P)-dependent oxidoreductase [Litorivicinus sp.]|nr:NAD(P)-dependent oxidoreductase [Litorivicinus sp.]
MTFKTKVVVTGSSGLACSLLLDRFSQLEAYSFLFTDNRSGCASEKNFIMGDITSYEFCLTLLKGASCLIHLAGCSNPDGSARDILSANIVGAHNLFTACAENEVNKIIFASSNRVVEGLEDDCLNSVESVQTEHDTENLQFFPTRLYGASKVWGEALLDVFCSEDPRRKAISLRVGTLWPVEFDALSTDELVRTILENNGGFYNEIDVASFRRRQSFLRVSSRKWQSAIEKILGTEWTGHVIRALDANGESWITERRGSSNFKFFGE